MASASSVAELESPPIMAPATAVPRRWPALVLLVVGILASQSPYLYQLAPDVVPAMPTFMASMFAPMLATLLLVFWWLLPNPSLFSNGRSKVAAGLRQLLGWVIGESAPWLTRLGSVGLAALIVAVAVLTAHPTARFYLFTKAIPITTGVVVILLCIVRPLVPGLRLSMVVNIAVLTLVPWELVRFNGVTGQFGMDPQWRWHPDPEALAAAYDNSAKPDASTPEAPLTASATDWPCFRGPHQDSVVTGIQLGDWQTQPRELWRRAVGPGWSSFCVIGDRLFTQEQRGEKELVVCYRASTGAKLWATGNEVRYSDPQSGVGPRGTPTFHDGKLYTFGATGILNCLDPATGKELWKVDLTEKVGATRSPFGFASSPLAIGDRIIVHPGSPTGPRLAAYHAQTGEQLWTAGPAAVAYTTPHRATLCGVEQVLVYSGDGLFGHDPVSGEQLWKYDWKAEMTAPVCVQPMLLSGERILLGGGRPGIKSRCIKLNRYGETWTVEDVWESPYTPAFNDMVRIGENIYGLESGRLVCLDANTGKRRWKEGDYGAGQVLLAGNRLIVLSEKGRLALVNPNPESWQQLTIFSALSDKTWNHPVIANGKLFIRNAEEMVCYEVGQ